MIEIHPLIELFTQAKHTSMEYSMLDDKKYVRPEEMDTGSMTDRSGN
jgi:hypothetical protein